MYGDVIARSFYERVLEPSNSRARYTHSLRARVTHDSYALIRLRDQNEDLRSSDVQGLLRRTIQS